MDIHTQMNVDGRTSPKRKKKSSRNRPKAALGVPVG